MGNAIYPCFQSSTSSLLVKLIFYGGKMVYLSGKRVAGEIMFEFPDHMVCHADSFFIGHPIPVLAIDDELLIGETYFVLPLDRLTSSVLSPASLAALGSTTKRAPINFKDCPFQYLKGSNGRVLIKVIPDFIIKLMNRGQDGGKSLGEGHSFLCNTPELKKHYDQLVGSKEQAWSPKLETISEYKIRYSPCRFIGLERKEAEGKC